MDKKRVVLEHFMEPKEAHVSLRWHQGDRTLAKTFHRVKVSTDGDKLVFHDMNREGKISDERQVEIREDSVLLFFDDEGQMIEVEIATIISRQ